ncbi:MAG: hypothetical protein QOJ03_674 [Frankiaceae bacterium]|jgi:hypothetical protein|nr:hypothetical protein [Frankiaceae bacterium]
MTTPELACVRMQGVPVRLWQLSQEHSDELLREFMLIAAERRRSHSDHDVPQRLTALIDELNSQYAGFSEANEGLLGDAAAAGLDSIDLVYEIPAAVADAATRLGDLLDAADDYCRRGEHLLTLATPAPQVAFRRWFLNEFVRQIAGEPPLPWPDYAEQVRI